MTSTTADRRSENVGVLPVVVPELKLRDVERHIFLADFVERADHAAFEDDPKSFNGIGVDGPKEIYASGMIDGRVRVFTVQFLVPGELVSAEQADFVGNGLTHEINKRVSLSVCNDASDDIALTPHSTSDNGFAGSNTASAITSTGSATGRPLALAVFFIPMLVVEFAADESFVHLDDAPKLFLRLDERGADFVAHAVGGFVGAEAHLPLHLEGADTLFAGQHEMNDFEPLAQGLVGVLEDRPGNMGEPIALIRGAGVALPLEGHGPDRKDLHSATARAIDAIGPATGDQVPLAGVLIPDRENGLELGLGHLMNGLGAFGLSHGRLPQSGGQNG